MVGGNACSFSGRVQAALAPACSFPQHCTVTPCTIRNSPWVTRKSLLSSDRTIQHGKTLHILIHCLFGSWFSPPRNCLSSHRSIQSRFLSACHQLFIITPDV